MTGANGRIAGAVAAFALADGHSVVAIDRTPPSAAPADGTRAVTLDMTDYDAVLAALKGCDALIHLAAIPVPFKQPDHKVHNNNVVGSYNAMRAAVECGIDRICQASSVNAIGLSFSRKAHFDYFPLDEAHPDHNEEAYGLSKQICERQADSLARRYETLSIASIRFHWVVSDRAEAGAVYNLPEEQAGRHLWGYALYGPAARACLLALDADFRGHEVFYIAAPDTTNDIPSLELARRWHPDVPIRGDLSGHRSFFDCSKAERLLGWRHDDAG
ncbi:NAD(P)-dependent oxidoreductase [Aureimonas leprariae]|uniref:NAD(P)-dependent oxidoreductase n=1 Tax=Plantimonas leprariae TaxID=2615207 RepID=A0A7V7PLY5_9HYPH|nr:NAD(P)-dependent oxidoreductase [Aureimonas leprariae]